MYLLVFAAVAVLEFAAAVSIYLMRDVLHATLALSMAFLLNSFAFLALQQALLAVIQAFIVIGGIATYLIVGTAAGKTTSFRHVRLPAFVALFLLFSAVLDYSVYGTGFAQLQHNIFSASGIAPMFSSMALLYLIVMMLFAVSLGSILIFNRFRKHGGGAE